MPHLDLSEEEAVALVALLTRTITNDRYPLSPRVLKPILAKLRPEPVREPLPAAEGVCSAGSDRSEKTTRRPLENPDNGLIAMDDFTNENDALSFERWLERQGVIPATPEELKDCREDFDDAMQRRKDSPPAGPKNLPPLRPDEQRYAVAIRDRSALWLTLWIKCDPQGDIYVFVPRADRPWNAHTSYHHDGKFHSKSYGRKRRHEKRQPLVPPENFRGSEHLGADGSHGIGIVRCDPKDFNEVIIVEPGILDRDHGSVVVDLVQPGYAPKPGPSVTQTRVFYRGAHPSVAITICPHDQAVAFLHWPDDFVKGQ